MRKHITLARQETSPVLDEATTLIEQRKENETKQRLLNAFTKHFIISDEDLVALASSVEPVDSHFFAVLSRVKQVHSDCQVLLGGENQRLGLEIMEQSSKHLSSGYQKLYKWIQKEFKSLNLEDPQMNSSMRHALHVLAERPTMFHSCLDFFAEAREYILFALLYLTYI
jgi:conserved oligomeric Golgi complex subunit 6